MRIKSFTFLCVVTAALQLSGCTKDTASGNDEGDLHALSIEFDNIVGGQNLFLNTVNYNNTAGEQFTVSQLQYFVSNIQLERADGSRYVVPQDSSYFLIQESVPGSRYANVKVPAGDYTRLHFIIGVDSLRSTMDVSRRTGVLDPTAGMEDGMYWSWNSGYIFFKMEGTSPSAPVDPAGLHKYRFHIGGFGGYSSATINNIRNVSIDLRQSGIAQVRTGRKSNIHLMADILKVVNGTNTVSLAANSTVMFGDYSSVIANNYTQMFVHDHTEN